MRALASHLEEVGQHWYTLWPKQRKEIIRFWNTIIKQNNSYFFILPAMWPQLAISSKIQSTHSSHCKFHGRQSTTRRSCSFKPKYIRLTLDTFPGLVKDKDSFSQQLQSHGWKAKKWKYIVSYLFISHHSLPFHLIKPIFMSLFASKTVRSNQWES